MIEAVNSFAGHVFASFGSGLAQAADRPRNAVRIDAGTAPQGPRAGYPPV